MLRTQKVAKLWWYLFCCPRCHGAISVCHFARPCYGTHHCKFSLSRGLAAMVLNS